MCVLLDGDFWCLAALSSRSTASLCAAAWEGDGSGGKADKEVDGGAAGANGGGGAGGAGVQLSTTSAASTALTKALRQESRQHNT